MAHEALEAARDAEKRYEIIDQLESDIERLVELYQAVMVMGSAVEAIAASETILTEEEIAQKC